MGRCGEQGTNFSGCGNSPCPARIISFGSGTPIGAQPTTTWARRPPTPSRLCTPAQSLRVLCDTPQRCWQGSTIPAKTRPAPGSIYRFGGECSGQRRRKVPTPQRIMAGLRQGDLVPSLGSL